MTILGVREKELVQQGDHLFGKRSGIISLWQEMAESFYPERADFTVNRYHGEEFASHLSTSYPLIVRRDMGNTISSMLRPRGQDWFNVSTMREDKLDNNDKAWLEMASKLQRRVMYSKDSQFVRATKQGDHDFVTFGQCVISAELNRNKNGLLYRNHHLRDVAWSENDEGVPDNIHRKWKPTAKVLSSYKNFDLHPKIREALEKDPYHEFNCRHIIMPADQYDSAFDGKRATTKFVSVYFDLDNGHIMEETPINHAHYVIPRWQTVSGSQYAHSPCTVAALPDARLLQGITLTLLEAGEKATNPPMIAQTDVVKSDVAFYAGGLTWVDEAYDERLGAALRPIPQDYSGIPLGMEIRDEVRRTITEAFYLNKLSLPPPQGDMTATEIGQRVEEYVRNALPLFEPMEEDYNAQLCERSFELIMEVGGFGSAQDMPANLRGQEVKFNFESPLHEASERKKGHTFMEAKAMLTEAASVDPKAIHILDVTKALRDSLGGIRVAADWMRDENTVDQMGQADQEKMQEAEMISKMSEAGSAAKDLGAASANFAKGGQTIDGLS